jgi:malonyl-CoA O-methyltransferase
MQTNIIKHNFNKASLSYDAAATVQYNAAKHLVFNLIKNCSEFNPSSILDLGTGTGYIPELLLNYFPKSQYILNDISENMLNKTKQKLNNYTNIQFNLNDMETTDFGFNQLIISNMALQWVKNLNNLLIKLFNNSNILAFSCLLNQNFDEWNYILKNLNLPIITHK